MARKQNTDRSGSSFSEEIKIAVWKKAKAIAGKDSKEVRKDLCGAIIEWDKYGETDENGNGWEIDHIKPVAEGGGDELANLQPLQWQNNREKSDDYPASGFCKVVAKN